MTARHRRKLTAPPTLETETKSITDTIDFIAANAITAKTRQELVTAAIEGMLSSPG